MSEIENKNNAPSFKKMLAKLALYLVWMAITIAIALYLVSKTPVQLNNEPKVDCVPPLSTQQIDHLRSHHLCK